MYQVVHIDIANDPVNSAGMDLIKLEHEHDHHEHEQLRMNMSMNISN